MRIHGIESLTLEDLERELAAGGRFVFFEYCISLVFLTLRRPSGVYFIRAGNRALPRGLPYALISFLLGWWGVPWGLIYTPITLFANLSGGCDITPLMISLLRERPEEVLASLQGREHEGLA